MPEYQFANNVSTTLNEPGGVLVGDTTITVDDGSVFPTPMSGKTMLATIIKAATSQVEIVKITAISTNDLTIVRAQEGTTALAFDDGDAIEMRLTAGILDSFQLYDEITIPLSSETADAEVASAVTSWFPKYNYKLHSIAVVASVAPTGSAAQFDMNDEGVSMLSTVVSIDAGEDDSGDAATPPVISDDVITAGNKYTFDIDQVGATIPGKGYKARLVVSRT